MSFCLGSAVAADNSTSTLHRILRTQAFAVAAKNDLDALLGFLEQLNS
jgi:hypothetical protein